MDLDGSDLFVHCDDLTKAGMTKDFLRTAKHGNIIRFSFLILEYFGKYNKSRKAVDLKLIEWVYIINKLNIFIMTFFFFKINPYLIVLYYLIKIIYK